MAVAFLAIGAVFFLVSALGVLKFPDVFTRMHAASKASSLGLGLILMGVAVHFESGAVMFKCGLIVLFVFLTTPIAAHILGRAAYLSGAKIWDGTVVDEIDDFYKDKRHIPEELKSENE